MANYYHIWSLEKKPVSVRLKGPVGVRICAYAQDMTGLESGGILWGRVQNTGDDHYVVSIEGAEAVRCDHSRGEGWALSERDRHDLATRLCIPRGDLRPVGFWRTHLRLGLYMDNRDMDLMREFFPEPYCVGLCVRETSTAGYFIWEDGDVRRTSSYREFQLPDAGQSADVALPGLRQGWRGWSAGVAACILTAAPVFIVARHSHTPAPFNVLSMRAETKPGTVRLNWNPASKVFESGSAATLWVADGLEESRIELTATQLRSGYFDYVPASEDVNFRMQVGNFTESLRLTSASPGAPLQLASVVENAPPAPEPEPKPRRVSKRVRSAPRPMKAIQIAHRRHEKPRDIEVPAPPVVQTAIARLERPPIAPAPIKTPTVVASLEKPNSSGLKKAFGWIIPPPKDFVEAKPIRQVQPEAKVEEPTSVAVKVEIDQQGVVRDADLITKQVEGNLGRSAVEAAKGWLFEPARAEDRPVTSSVVVRFSFRREHGGGI